LIVVPRPLPAAALVVRRRYLIVVPKPMLGETINTASKLEPHTQTDRGTCPGMGL
jgi:hypothetical protein